METAIHHSIQVREGAATEAYPALEKVTRTHVPTGQAAYYLNRRAQTLRAWAMDGRIVQPIRVNGRLAWPVDGIKAALGVK